MTLPALPASGSTSWYSYASALDAAVRAGGTGGGASLNTVPTLEELERVALVGTVSANATVRLGAVNFDQRIGAITLGTSTALAASDTNYWSVSLLRLRTGQNPLTIATKTTKATLGEAFTADQGWNFDSTFWLETARHLRKGDSLAISFTKTGTPSNLADVTVAVRYEPGVVPIIRDTFSRPDSATNLGTTDTGQTWTQLVGTWGISGGAGYCSTIPGDSWAVFDAGRADYTISIRASVASGFQGLAFRVQDASNAWALTNDGLWRQVAGTWTEMVDNPSLASGDTLTVVCSGPTVSGYKNGLLLGTISDTNFQTATKVGMYIGSGGAAARLDDLALAV